MRRLWLGLVFGLTGGLTIPQLGCASGTGGRAGGNGSGTGASGAKAGTSAWEAAARAELLARGDRDHSGVLEAGEIVNLGCEVWRRLDGELLRDAEASLLTRYGFEAGYLYRGQHLGVADASRVAAASTLAECLGQTPEASDEAMALVRAITDLARPATSDWDAEVKRLLVAAFDRDGSGSINRGDEVTRVPCAVWIVLADAALAERELDFMALYGFSEGYLYAGTALGISDSERETAADQMRACGLRQD